MKKLFFIAVSLFVITSVSAQRARPQTDNARAGRNAATVSVRGTARTATRGAAASGAAARQRAGAATARAARAVGAKTARAGVVTAAPTVATTTAAVATTTTTTKAEEDMTAAELTAKFNEQMKKVEAVLDVQSQCQEKFNSCMDNFCNDNTVGRCLCSASYSSLKPLQDEIKSLTEATNQLLQEEMAKAKMSDTERAFYEKQVIALKESSDSSNVYGSMTIDSLTSGMFTGKDTGDFSNKTGSELFTQAKKSCQPILDACPSESSSITSFYQTATGKSCQTKMTELEEQKNTIQFARNKAEFEVKQAAFATVSKKLDNSTCLIQLKDLVQEDALCGSGYKNCLACNEEFTGSYTLELFNVDGSVNTTKNYSGCAATNIEKIMAKKDVFSKVLDTCMASSVAWNTFMIDFASQMTKSEKEQAKTYADVMREREFEVGDVCQKEIDKCLQEICGSGYISCTGKEKAAQYNIALIDSESAQDACLITYARCDTRLVASEAVTKVEDIWAAAWMKAQSEADQTYQKKLSSLITETGNVEKAQAKMEAELAEAKARSENTIARLTSVLEAENALSDAKLSAQKAKAETEEALALIEKTKATQTADDAENLGKAQRGCQKFAGTWKNGTCYWAVTANGYTCAKGKKGRGSFWNACAKDKNRTPVSKTTEFAAGTTFTCTSSMMGVETDNGCSWNGGAIGGDRAKVDGKKDVGTGSGYTFPTLDELIANSDIGTNEEQ